MSEQDNPEKEASAECSEDEASSLSKNSSLSGDAMEIDDVFEGAEPWHPIETKIVIGSFLAAIFFLAVFGYLINKFIL